jgi:hypothetical protein
LKGPHFGGGPSHVQTLFARGEITSRS